MVGYRFLRSAAIALITYGVLGLVIAAAMLVVGFSTFDQVTSLQRTLENERLALVGSIRTVSGTLRDTSGATSDFQKSIDQARGAADNASKLSNDAAGSFRQMAAGVTAITIFGVQPLGGIAPQFASSADQLQQLAISLGSTRDALAQNGTDVQRVGTDLGKLQKQLDDVANSLSQPGVLGFEPQSMVPFQVAFYGMCLLVILQAAFSIVAGMVLYRLQRALGEEALFPHINPRIKTATTIDGRERDRVRVS
jgi:hypothetical protein